MKKLVLLFVLASTLTACNLSDGVDSLPNGYLYVREGNCYKYIRGHSGSKKTFTMISTVIHYEVESPLILICTIDPSYCEKLGGDHDVSKINPDSINYVLLDTKDGNILNKCKIDDIASMPDSLRGKYIDMLKNIPKYENE
ncbi:hypothetical protein [Siphonobacter sp. SORGH_AS_1065]|uniref:hypothetical protein n=1 Tax=Siphonobacter sp. SORGH_AS_1065 TaxID=3041795 RepID=UPI0027D7989D|nr:hypothetical protein [Siphonobacter sp. SORGH_AS_1065]